VYKCIHFEIHELVSRRIYEDHGELAWELLDDRLLITIDRLRERYGKTTINNYHWGGNRQWSGLRTPDSPYYTPYSQHTFGRAADCLFRDYTAQAVRTHILNNPGHTDFMYITSVERGTSWLHIDTRNCNRIKAFYP